MQAAIYLRPALPAFSRWLVIGTDSVELLLQAAECGNPQSKDAGVARGISDFSLDDLLGLGPDPGPNEAPEAPTPSSDPFHVRMSPISTDCCPVHHKLASPCGVLATHHVDRIGCLGIRSRVGTDTTHGIQCLL